MCTTSDLTLQGENRQIEIELKLLEGTNRHRVLARFETVAVVHVAVRRTLGLGGEIPS